MNIIDRYLYRTVIVYTLMVMAVLMTLGALFVFISQQSDISAGGYSTTDALLFTLLNLLGLPKPLRDAVQGIIIIAAVAYAAIGTRTRK